MGAFEMLKRMNPRLILILAMPILTCCGQFSIVGTSSQTNGTTSGSSASATISVDGGKNGSSASSTISVAPSPRPSPTVNLAINKIQPALASRATACLMCHASVASNVITDFGAGSPWFFGGTGITGNTVGGSFYGDFDYSTGSLTSWGTLRLSAGATVYVPHAETTGLNVAQPTLASYLTYILQNSTVPTSRSAKVTELASLYIGAPTAARIRQVGSLDANTGLKFFPTGAESASFSGISLDPTGQFYRNSGTIVCDGDLVLDRTLWLTNATIATVSGCRIYDTHSVFITGPITYSSSAGGENLQITSSAAVLLGVGHGCLNGDIYSDSYTWRLNDTDPSHHAESMYTRSSSSPRQMLANIRLDADQLGSRLLDAGCTPEGRNVSFTHILINAPLVESRYNGGFNGSIIGEIVLMSRTDFQFSFDPVLLRTPILPLLSQDDFLSVTF